MCEYCEKSTRCIISLNAVSEVNDTWACIDKREDGAWLVMEQDCGSVNVSTEAAINFCPMCGRDLREERR